MKTLYLYVMSDWNLKMKTLKGSIVSLLFFISGCSEIIPVNISESQQNYIGVWHYAHKIETDTRFDIKNVVLSLQSDSTAIYKTCSVVVEKESVMRSSSTNSVHLSSAIITQLTDTEIFLVQETGIINLDYDLVITKKPFKENNSWYVEIDNVLLSKQDNSSLTQLIELDCPDAQSIELGIDLDSEPNPELNVGAAEKQDEN